MIQYPKIGVTGSRDGPVTREQASVASSIFYHLWGNQGSHELHHGDCVGVDEWAATIHGAYMYLVSHPPIDPVLRAFVPSDVEWDPAPYLARNRDIVLETDLLIALPADGDGQGGTGYTIRFAREVDKPVVIVYRDGSVLAPTEGFEWKP